uniref:Uncharacterized protein n=1 Tax=Populus davidiana TaxID=266767 RepID=A0A6M2EIA0_9ROSI
MFESTLELITQAASNSFVIFCFCNLIIVMILMGSKPVFNFDQEREFPRSVVSNTHTKLKEDILAKPSSLDDNEISIDDRNVSITQEEPTGDGDEDNGEDGYGDEDDELWRRSEEFINKINHGWRTESSRRHV